MEYEKSSERRKPEAESSELIELAIQDIRSTKDTSAAGKEPRTAWFYDWLEDYAKYHGVRLAYDVDYVARYVPEGSKVLECGSVPPILTTALAKLGYDVYGMDIAPERFASAINALGLNIAKVDLEKEALSFPDHSFDAVVFNELFEHLRIDLIATMTEILRVLRPGGTLLLSTPNLTSFLGLTSLILKNKVLGGSVYHEYHKLQEFGHMGHVRVYTVDEVCEFLETIGFDVSEVIHRGFSDVRSGWKRVIAGAVQSAMPRYRPYFSVIASKLESTSTTPDSAEKTHDAPD